MYYGFTNWADISRYVSHNFTVIDNVTITNVTGSCSFPSFEATPYALYAGDDLTYNWTMNGDISSHVYLSLHSGWGTQYYYSGIVVNDGSHTITLPSQLNPNLDYTVYVESAFQDVFLFLVTSNWHHQFSSHLICYGRGMGSFRSNLKQNHHPS